MSEFKSHLEVPMGSERSFGIVFAVVFASIGLYPLVGGGGIRLWALVVALVLLALAYWAPRTLSVPNKLWFKLGLVLGAIIAPIALALIYFAAVTPTGLIARLIGKDLLGQKLDKKAKSYWVERNQPVGSMKDQF
ncbi:MAG: SxtJ family membrane protein [Sedimenticola sp.]